MPKGIIADVAPVRHGWWVDNHCTACGMMPMGDEMWKLCDFEPPRFEKFMDYCPNCGAKMAGGDTDIERGATDAFDAFDDALQDTPTVDAEVVVRCKDCRKFKTYACRMVASGYNDFCSYGERKSNEYAEG